MTASVQVLEDGADHFFVVALFQINSHQELSRPLIVQTCKILLSAHNLIPGMPL